MTKTMSVDGIGRFNAGLCRPALALLLSSIVIVDCDNATETEPYKMDITWTNYKTTTIFYACLAILLFLAFVSRIAVFRPRELIYFLGLLGRDVTEELANGDNKPESGFYLRFDHLAPSSM